jgi:hypothetical protein
MDSAASGGAFTILQELRSTMIDNRELSEKFEETGSSLGEKGGFVASRKSIQTSENIALYRPHLNCP